MEHKQLHNDRSCATRLIARAIHVSIAPDIALITAVNYTPPSAIGSDRNNTDNYDETTEEQLAINCHSRDVVYGGSYCYHKLPRIVPSVENATTALIAVGRWSGWRTCCTGGQRCGSDICRGYICKIGVTYVGWIRWAPPDITTGNCVRITYSYTSTIEVIEHVIQMRL